MKNLLELPDYRKCKQIKFNVGEVMYLSLLAMLAGANGYEDMAYYKIYRMLVLGSSLLSLLKG